MIEMRARNYEGLCNTFIFIYEVKSENNVKKCREIGYTIILYLYEVVYNRLLLSFHSALNILLEFIKNLRQCNS